LEGRRVPIAGVFLCLRPIEYAVKASPLIESGNQ
jgi:hypothetical protein